MSEKHKRAQNTSKATCSKVKSSSYFLVMFYVHIVFHDGIPGLGIKPNRMRQRIPSGIPKPSTASDNRHLPDVHHHRIPAKDTDTTPIEVSLGELVVQHHQQWQFFLGCKCVHSLRLSDHLWWRILAFCQSIIHHICVAKEARIWGSGDLDCWWGFATVDVVEEEMKAGCFLHSFHWYGFWKLLGENSIRGIWKGWKEYEVEGDSKSIF